MTASGEGRRFELLLVEDNPGDVRLTREALKEQRFASNLSVARDGVEALRFLRREAPYVGAPRPDLVLLDLNLPRKDGRRVLQEMRDDPALCTLPVVVLTSSDAERDVAAAYELRANAFVTKPTDLDHFLAVIRSIEDFWFGTVKLPPPPAS